MLCVMDYPPWMVALLLLAAHLVGVVLNDLRVLVAISQRHFQPFFSLHWQTRQGLCSWFDSLWKNDYILIMGTYLLTYFLVSLAS